MRKHKFYAICIVTAMAILAIAFSATPVSAATTTDVSVSPTNESVTAGDSVAYDIIVEDVDNGIGSYSFNASVENSNVATITDYELQGTSPDDLLTSVESSDDNATLDVTAGAASHSDGTIATITISADSAAAGSETNLSVSDIALGDADSQSYTVEKTTPATVFIPSATDDDTGDEPFDGVVLSPSPVSNEVPVDSETDIDITLSNASEGVGPAAFNLSVGSTDAAKITAIDPTGVSAGSPIVDVNIADDGSSGTLDAGSIDIDENVIATVTVEGVSEQNTTLSIKDPVISNENFTSYAVNTNDGELVVTENTGSAAPPEVISGTQPSNIQGSDGLGDTVYEDINGDGQFNIVDAGAFFKNYNTDAVQNNIDAFDYNDDGNVDIIDAGYMFQQAAS